MTRVVLLPFLAMGFPAAGIAQVTVIPFTSGPIPLCDTSTFTANVSGIGTLYPPGWNWWSYSLAALTINITSDHPQTLEISITSPQGTTLLLSAFNGAGGQNYTNTQFTDGWPSITTGSAPFTGLWTAQGGPLSTFDYENANGTWTITVIDTACANTGGGGGGGGTNAWTPGWFDGSTGSGGFAFGFTGPPPCWDPGLVPYGQSYLCPGATVDIQDYYQNNLFGFTVSIGSWSGLPMDPSAVSEPGNYWVEAYDPWSGCTFYGNYDVYSSPQVALGSDQAVSQCTGAGPVNLAPLFNTAGASYLQWSLDGANIPAATAASASAPGAYQLIASNYGGCGDSAVVTLTITPDPVLGPDQTIGICAGSSADLTTLYNTVGYTTDWSFGGSPFPTPAEADAAGVYTLTASTMEGCTATAQVTLDQQAAPALGGDQSLVLCSNDQLDLNALYTTAGLATSWTISGAPVTDPSAVNTAGTYRLIAENSSGCTDTSFVSVNTIPPPALGPDASTTICAGDLLDLTTYFATNGLSTAWTSSGAIVPDPASVSSGGVYNLIASTLDGCRDTANVNVVVSANPALGPDQSLTSCAGSFVDLTGLYSVGADLPTWSSNGLPIADPSSVSQAGEYVLLLTNSAGCTASASVVLSFDPSPAVGDDQTYAICSGTTMDLTALFPTSGLVTTWSLGGSPVADPGAVAAGGEYRLVATNGFGCTDTATVSVTVHPAPSLGADRSFTLCPWQTVDLSAAFPVNGMTPYYTLNGIPVTDPTSVSDTGTYVISVTDAFGCGDEATASISAMECLCLADFVQDARCVQDPVQFTLVADSTVLGAQWEFNGAATASIERDPKVGFTVAGEVSVTLEATLSCGVVRVQRTVHVPDCSDSCRVWIPSAFTPDNNSLNDAWTWRGECHPEDFSVEIFDRWGEMIFSSKDPASTWDGTYNGVLSPSGLYAYRVGYRLPYQERKEVTGSITLLR